MPIDENHSTTICLALPALPEKSMLRVCVASSKLTPSLIERIYLKSFGNWMWAISLVWVGFAIVYVVWVCLFCFNKEIGLSVVMSAMLPPVAAQKLIPK